MGALYYRKERRESTFKFGEFLAEEERNSFSSTPRKNQGKLIRKGLYGKMNPRIKKYLETGKL